MRYEDETYKFNFIQSPYARRIKPILSACSFSRGANFWIIIASDFSSCIPAIMYHFCTDFTLHIYLEYVSVDKSYERKSLYFPGTLARHALG